MDTHHPIRIHPQPTESTCGATCLQAIYHFYENSQSLKEVIAEIPELNSGGVYGVQLGIHALKKGFQAKIFTLNLRVFDPTWFSLDKENLKKKLQAQLLTEKSHRVKEATQLYWEFLELGGELGLQTLSPEFLRGLIRKGPIVTGLSATFLYRSKREWGPKCDYDDVRGEPQGHFVVIAGMEESSQSSWIADPHEKNPVAEGQHYSVTTIELINAILLGVITYDANLILIEPRSSS